MDIYLHEPDEMGAFSMELIIERTIPLGMQGKVMVSHAFCLGMPDAALDVITTGAAQALGLEDYGLSPGCRGDMVLVEAETIAEAVAARPGRRTVVKQGRMVARDGMAEI